MTTWLTWEHCAQNGRKGGTDLPATLSHCIACEPVVQVWITGIKVGNHARSSARPSRFTNSRLCSVCVYYAAVQYFTVFHIARSTMAKVISHHGGLGMIPGQYLWHLWWKKLYLNRFCLIMTFRFHLVDSLLVVNRMWPWKLFIVRWNCSNETLDIYCLLWSWNILFKS